MGGDRKYRTVTTGAAMSYVGQVGTKNQTPLPADQNLHSKMDFITCDKAVYI